MTAEIDFNNVETETVPKLRRGQRKINMDEVMTYAKLQPKFKSTDYTHCFKKWNTKLDAGFNLLIRGRGSTIQLLKSFMKQKPNLIEVYGHSESTKISTIFQKISERTGVQQHVHYDTMIADVARLRTTLHNRHIHLLIHNLDAENLRDPLCLSALAELVSDNPQVTLVASMAFPYGDIYWDPELKRDLNFSEYNVNTCLIDLEEFGCLNRRLIAKSSGKKGNQHTAESLDQIWTSLPTNSQKAMILLYEMILNDENHVVELFDLCKKLKENFLVNSEIALESMLHEYESHALIEISDVKTIRFIVDLIVLGVFMDTKMLEKI